MRLLTASIGCALAVLSASCGSGHNVDEFAFRSLAHDPVGDPVTIAYRFDAGESVHIQVDMETRATARGVRKDADRSKGQFSLVYTCTEVRANGDAVLRMASADAPDAGATFVVDSDGVVKERRLVAEDPDVDHKLASLVNGAGVQPFVTLPPYGLRVGEALDLAPSLPFEVLAANLLRTARSPTTIQPAVQGELVLLGTKEIDGERCAEFAINVVVSVAGSLSKKDKMAHGDVLMRMRGTQFTSLRTGLAHGPARVDITLRAGTYVGGTTVFLKTESTMRVIATSRHPSR